VVGAQNDKKWRNPTSGATAGLTAPVRQFILEVTTNTVVGAQNDSVMRVSLAQKQMWLLLGVFHRSR
jgi:hypothetical protein